MTKFLYVLVVILSALVTVKFLFGSTACITCCACLVGLYLYCRKSEAVQQQHRLWLPSVVDYIRSFRPDLQNHNGKVVEDDEEEEEYLYQTTTKNNKHEKLSDCKASEANTKRTTPFLTAMFSYGKPNLSLFSLFSGNKKNEETKTMSLSTNRIGNNSNNRRKHNHHQSGARRKTTIDGELSRSSPLVSSTPIHMTTMSTRYASRRRIVVEDGTAERLRTNTPGRYGSPLAGGGRSSHLLSSSLPRFHRTAFEPPDRPTISPVGFTPHALQRPETCYPVGNSPGVLPHVRLQKRIKIPLVESNINRLRSPVTVKIAPPETGIIHSPKFTSLKHDVSVPTSQSDVLSALQEGSRKRTNNEEDSIILINNANAKRRRQESNHSTASSSSMPSLSDFLPDLSICNFSPSYMSPTSRCMSTAAAMVSTDGSGGGGGSLKRPAAPCVHAAHPDNSPNLKKARHGVKINSILSSLSSSFRYKSRQRELEKRKRLDSFNTSLSQGHTDSKENHEATSSDHKKSERPLSKVSKLSRDTLASEDGHLQASSERQSEDIQLPNNSNSSETKGIDLQSRRKYLSFATPSINLEKLSYANVYATKQDYENDRKAEQERVENMLSSIANDNNPLQSDQDITGANTGIDSTKGIEVSKTTLPAAKTLGTAITTTSTSTVATSAVASAALSPASTTSAAVPTSFLSTTLGSTAPTSSSPLLTQLTSSTASISSVTSPLSSSLSAPKPSTSTDLPTNTENTEKSSLVSTTTTSAGTFQPIFGSPSKTSLQTPIKGGFQFDIKSTSEPTATTKTVVKPSVSSLLSGPTAAATINTSFVFGSTASTLKPTAASTEPSGTSIASSGFSMTTLTTPTMTAPVPQVDSTQQQRSNPSTSFNPISSNSQETHSPFTFSSSPARNTKAIPSATESSTAPSSTGGFTFSLAAASPIAAGSASVSQPTAATSADAVTPSPAVAKTSPGGFVFKSTTTISSASASTTSPPAPGLFAFGNSANSKSSPFSFSNTTSPTTTTASTQKLIPSVQFGSPATATPIFGSPSTSATSIFGKSGASAAATFGAPNTTAVAAFGASSTTTFGSPSTTAFGVPSATATATFGAPSTTAATPFGAPSTTAATPFGAPSTTTATPFGAPSATAATAFGAPSATAAAAFGAPSTTATATFGAPSTTSSIFGAPSTAAIPAFGAPNTTVAPAFGAPSTTVAPAFGAPSTTVAPAFGAPSTTGAAPIFGSPSTTTAIFGSPSTIAAPTFGASSTGVPAFGSQSSTAPFGASNSSTKGFGASPATSLFAASSAPNTQTKAIFGATTTQSAGFNFSFSSNAPAKQTGSSPFVFGNTTATAASPSMTTASNSGTVTSTETAAGSSIFGQGSSAFGGFKAMPQSNQPSAPLGSTATGQTPSIFGSTATNQSSGFNFGGSSTNNQTSSIFDQSNQQPQTSIFGNNGQQQKTNQGFNFGQTATSGNQAPFGQSSAFSSPQPIAFGSFGNKPNIFSAQPSTDSNTAQTSTVFGQTSSSATSATAPATGAVKPVFRQGNPPAFGSSTAQSPSNSAIFGVAPAGQTTAPAKSATSPNTEIFTFGQSSGTQPNASQGYDFGASIGGTSQFNFGQGGTPSKNVMFNVGSGSTAPKMRSNNKARRRGAKK